MIRLLRLLSLHAVLACAEAEIRRKQVNGIAADNLAARIAEAADCRIRIAQLTI